MVPEETTPISSSGSNAPLSDENLVTSLDCSTSDDDVITKPSFSETEVSGRVLDLRNSQVQVNVSCSQILDLDLVSASLRIVDFCVEKNLFHEFMDAGELEHFNDFFKGRQGVDEHILFIIDRAFDKMLSSEMLARTEETQKDLALLNKERTDSKVTLLDALIAKKATVNTAIPLENLKKKDKTDDIEDPTM
uniref:Nudc_N domain-containing protein n=2 Tax=Steinernema glaseri TaxID=37863 RepID=A0A1I7Z0V0_9BILA